MTRIVGGLHSQYQTWSAWLTPRPTRRQQRRDVKADVTVELEQTASDRSQQAKMGLLN